MKRLAALQDWPELSSRAPTAASTDASMSEVPSRMKGSEPPSSSTIFLRLRPAISATAAPARSEPGQRDAAHALVADDALDLLVGRVDVDVGALGEAGVVEDPLHRLRGLRALRRVLEQDRVADDQVRAGEAGHLVVGEVPRHDPEQDAEGRAADQRGAVALEQVDRLVGEQLLGVVGVEVVDRLAELDLALGLLDRLAHLAHDDVRELVRAVGVEPARPCGSAPPARRRSCRRSSSRGPRARARSRRRAARR